MNQIADNLNNQADNQLPDLPEDDIFIQQRVIRNIEIVVSPGKNPERIDQFLARQVGELTRSQVHNLMGNGQITVDDKVVKPSYKVRPGEIIRLQVLSRPPLEVGPEDIPLDVLWEDEWLAIINKPVGMVVHPAAGNKTGTLVNALLGRYGKVAESDDPLRPGLVHRLDKETSGILVVCKREEMLSKMGELFRERTIDREYHAIAWWNLPKRKGTIEGAIGRDSNDRLKMTVRNDGKPARTHWEQLEKFDYLSYVALHLDTGRTHQIRVHMEHIGHPLFGDPLYSGRNRQMGRLTSAQRKEANDYLEVINRQMLHARTLGFKHPFSGEKLFFESKLPDDMVWLLEKLRSINSARKNAESTDVEK